MKARGQLVLSATAAIAAIASVVACDTSGNRTASTFPEPDPLSPTVVGRVRNGTEPLAGAIVRIVATPGTPDAATFAPGDAGQVATNVSGLYQFTKAPREYDLSIRSGNDVVVFREVFPRYMEPSFGDGATPAAFTAKVQAVIDPPTGADRELAFFVSGADAVGVSGDVTSGLVVAARSFSTTGTQPSPLVLHVVEHQAHKPLALATAYGSAPLTVIANQVSPVTVHMTSIAALAKPTTIVLSAPPGAAPSDIEIAMHFGQRLNAQRVGTVPSGVPISVVPVPDAVYTMHARATLGAATSDTGLQGFFPGAEKLDLELPAPPRPEGYADGALSADGEGVREHTLLAPDGSKFRAVTTARAVAITDLVHAGTGPIVGSFAWTVRHWPKLDHVENLGGPDNRVTFESATSAPVTVTIP